jgi:hypothetical protein
MHNKTAKIRLSRAVLSFLDGSGVGQCPAVRNPEAACSQRCSDDAHDFYRQILAAPNRKDGSVTVVVGKEGLSSLDSYAGAMEAGARDNVGHEPEALGELNAAVGLLRQVEKAWNEVVVNG